MAGSSAEAAGIMPGDMIVEYNGRRVYSILHLIQLVNESVGHRVPIVVERDGERVELMVKPAYDPELKRALIGVRFNTYYVASTHKVHPRPLAQLKAHAVPIVRVLRALVTPGEARQAAGSLGGPLAILWSLWVIIRSNLVMALWFTSFLTAVGIVMLCLNVIVRKQWTEHEKLAYPIIQLPLAITEGGGTSTFFRNRILWIGFALAAFIDILNGLNHFFPQVPRIPVRHNYHNLGRYFTTKPWNAIGWLPLPLYPFLIGLGFLLPLDLSFSIWFFFLFKNMLY